MQQMANVFEHRLSGCRKRHRGNVGMPERQYPGAQEELPVVVRAGEAEFCERIETAANSGARETGGGADLGDRQVVAPLGECLDHGEASSERCHEIWVAGKWVGVARMFDRLGASVRRRSLLRIEFRQRKPPGNAEIGGYLSWPIGARYFD